MLLHYGMKAYGEEEANLHTFSISTLDEKEMTPSNIICGEQSGTEQFIFKIIRFSFHHCPIVSRLPPPP
jgi:hypothetical protein